MDSRGYVSPSGDVIKADASHSWLNALYASDITGTAYYHGGDVHSIDWTGCQAAIERELELSDKAQHALFHRQKRWGAWAREVFAKLHLRKTQQTLVELLVFTRAKKVTQKQVAETLGVKPSTVSRRKKAIERRLSKAWKTRATLAGIRIFLRKVHAIY